jgi:hypothetical protein
MCSCDASQQNSFIPLQARRASSTATSVWDPERPSPTLAIRGGPQWKIENARTPDAPVPRIPEAIIAALNVGGRTDHCTRSVLAPMKFAARGSQRSQGVLLTEAMTLQRASGPKRSRSWMTGAKATNTKIKSQARLTPRVLTTRPHRSQLLNGRVPNRACA